MDLDERESIKQVVLECLRHPKKGDLYWGALNMFLWDAHTSNKYEISDRTDELLEALSGSKNKDVINFIRLCNYVKD
jgi:hypothetical protein